MQVSIRYADNGKADDMLKRAILQLARGYRDNIHLVGGSLGLNVSHLSWDESYEFVARLIEVIRRRGIGLIEGINIRVWPDYPPR